MQLFIGTFIKYQALSHTYNLYINIYNLCLFLDCFCVISLISPCTCRTVPNDFQHILCVYEGDAAVYPSFHHKSSDLSRYVLCSNEFSMFSLRVLCTARQQPCDDYRWKCAEILRPIQEALAYVTAAHPAWDTSCLAVPQGRLCEPSESQEASSHRFCTLPEKHYISYGLVHVCICNKS